MAQNCPSIIVEESACIEEAIDLHDNCHTSKGMSLVLFEVIFQSQFIDDEPLFSGLVVYWNYDCLNNAMDIVKTRSLLFSAPFDPHGINWFAVDVNCYDSLKIVPHLQCAHLHSFTVAIVAGEVAHWDLSQLSIVYWALPSLS